ncbi:Ig-like domain-containing protein [Sagittula sp. SSi028]|uniref:Ig-like domain-containing protein n=1 Tax=Sagittula sp. SSi028 TaxID=3400636 RepID=UPI003AF800F3
MADLVLDWGALGAYGTVLSDTDDLGGAPSATVDTGGVAVDVTFDGANQGAQAFTFNAGGYVAPGETYDPQSWLKLFGDNAAAPGATSTTTLDFRSTNDLFTDQVQNVSFRINDIDTGSTGDLSGLGGGFEDFVTVRAFDAEGNEVPVTFTPAGTASVTGNTLDGETTTGLEDAAGSVLVNVEGPVARIVIDYANGGTSDQRITISDVEFSTVDVVDNTPPEAVDDSATTDLDTVVTIDAVANDTDADGDPLSVVSLGTVTNGTAEIDPVTGDVNFTPAAGFIGDATIEYTVSDGQGGTDTGLITVTVTDPTDPNTPPVAVDDAAETDVDTPVSIDAAGNDTDADGDPLVVTEITSVTNGTATIDPVTNEVIFTPDAGFVGEGMIEYTVADGQGGTDTGTIMVTVSDPTDPNTPPVAVDDAATTDIDTPVSIDAVGNDTDADGDPLTVSEITTVTNGTAEVDPVTGNVVFTPTPGFTGEATIAYTVSDGQGGTDQGEISVIVSDPADPNTPPVAIDDDATTDNETPVVIDAVGNDTDADGDPLVVTELGTVTNGTAEIDPATGNVIFTPDPDFVGEALVEYTVSDGQGGTDRGFITIDVTDPINTAPTAVDDADTTPVDTPVSIDAVGNDTDPEGDTLTVQSIDGVTNGTAEIDPVTGNVIFTPDAGFVGEGTVDYTVSDGNGGTDTATITITVTDDPINTAPTAVDDADTTPVDTPVSIDAVGNDTDPEGDTLTVQSIDGVTNGTAEIDPVTGNVIFTPDAGFVGEGTVDYTVSDGNGGTDTATITITVTDDNSAPEAIDDAYETGPNAPLTLTPLANDSDPDGDPLTITSITQPDNGTAELDPTTGEILYTPNPEFTGVDTLEYTIDDGEGGTDTATITIGVGTANGGLGVIDTDVFPVDPALQPLDPLDGLDEDADPTDDLDTVTGTSGADLISTGDDADVINAGGGNDTVYSGIDDDRVGLGGGDDYIYDPQGADTISGGAGNDTIIVGTDTFSDYEGDDEAFAPGAFLNDTLGFTNDPNQEDGRDSVDGNTGDDYIETGDDRDTISGGQGNDTIYGGIDDDLIRGNADDDSLIGGHGSDTIDGGQGNDFIDGSNIAALEQTDDVDVNTENDRDLLQGFRGDDTILGGDDDDTLEGGSGNDLLDGGIDDDLIFGGADRDTLIGGQGDDTLNGGAGSDSIFGGEGRDTIIVDSATHGRGDTVDGGSDGFVDTADPSDPENGDFDVLDLTGVGVRGEDWRIVDTVTDSNGNGIDGTVEFLDGTGAVTGTMDFFEIEQVVPCFTPGTLIATPSGEKLVEDLEVGDRVITRDNGIQDIRWVGRKNLTGHELARKPHLAPILIKQGALGNGLPEHDMLVSPNHRVLVANDKTALYFEEREVLVAAKHLLGVDGIEEMSVGSVSYIHIMFEQHEVVLSNGAWTESFQPGDYSLKGIGNAQRQEILELFPELAEAEGLRGYAAARRSLKRHEAALLVN